jgi:ATPase domain predominantly from Archaea
VFTLNNSQKNPYIIGRPIDDQDLFFGRESLFSCIKENLHKNKQLILLHGQPRIGKSSIIRMIPEKLQDMNEFVFVLFNLEDSKQKALGSILAALAQEIVNHPKLDGYKIKLPKSTELELKLNIFFHHFLPQLYQKLESSSLVLLMDEFDSLISDSESTNFFLEKFFRVLYSRIKKDKKLFIFLCIGQQSANTYNMLKIFDDPPNIKIGLLDKDSTKNLITQPAKGILEYEEDAIEAIFNLSAGQPYFIQIICFAIFSRARENDNLDKEVSSADVEAIADKAIELGEGGLAWFWDVFSTPEKIAFSALAETQQIPESYLELLEIYGIDKENKLIKKAKQQLLDNGFLDESGQRIKLELVRRWIIKRHPLREEISKLELDKIEEKNHSDKEVTKLSQDNILNENNNIANETLEYIENEDSSINVIRKLNQPIKPNIDSNSVNRN